MFMFTSPIVVPPIVDVSLTPMIVSSGLKLAIVPLGRAMKSSYFATFQRDSASASAIFSLTSDRIVLLDH